MAHRTIENAADLADFTRWYPAPGYEGRYEITRDGRVRSLSRYVNSPAAGGRRLIAGRELKLQSIRGYPGFITSLPNGRKRSVCVHRLLALAFIPNPLGKPEVNHIDGDKANHSLSNLEWVTHAENMRHAHATGLIPPSTVGPGERSPAAKLTWEKVRRIRALLANGQSRGDVAREFGVSKGAISFIANNQTWKI